MSIAASTTRPGTIYTYSQYPFDSVHTSSTWNTQSTPSVASSSQPSSTSQPARIASNAVIGAVLGAIGVAIICIAIVAIFCIRRRLPPGRGRNPTKNSQKTFSSQGTLSSPNMVDAHLESGATGRRRAKELEMSSIQTASLETMKTWERPIIEINTDVRPAQLKKSTTNASAYFLEQKRRMEMDDSLDEKESPILSGYPANGLRPSTPCSNASNGNSTMASVSPICFAELPSSSHLPLPRPILQINPNPDSSSLHKHSLEKTRSNRSSYQ